MTRLVEDGAPWYRYFWPWFLVSLMVISVAGSLATVYIAYAHRDIEVDRRPAIDTSFERDGRGG